MLYPRLLHWKIQSTKVVYSKLFAAPSDFIQQQVISPTYEYPYINYGSELDRENEMWVVEDPDDAHKPTDQRQPGMQATPL